MDNEKIATSAIVRSLSQTDVLSPFINEGDKEPVWDGNIYIHSGKNKTKENIRKVPVQVKSKKSNVFNKTTIMYRIDTEYLNDYLNDGGVFFFVVYISEDGSKDCIYYSDLLPVKLRIILSKAGDHKTTNIELKRFPDDNNEKVALLINYYNDMKKQTSFAHADLPSLEELSNNNMLDGLNITVSGYGKKPKDVRELFLRDGLYVYANVKGSSIPQPLLEIMSDVHYAEEVNASITVEGVTYYNSFTRIKSKDKTELVLGKSFHMVFDNINHNLNISFKLTSILRYAVIDLRFILAVSKALRIDINDVAFDFGVLEQPLYTEEQYNILSERLALYERITKLFEALCLNDEVDLQEFSDEDNRNTQRLINAILDKKVVSGLRHDIPLIAVVNYINTKLLLVFKRTENDGEYIITDYYKDDTFGSFRLINKKRVYTSKFAGMTAELFLSIGNIDYSKLIDSFRPFISEQYCIVDANQVLLEMINAYDKSNEKRKDILIHAKELSDFIISELSNEAVYRLNGIQIEKRLHGLSEEQKNELMEIIESACQDDKKQNEEIKFGANLLLDNQTAADYYYNRMDLDTREMYKEFPIFHYYHNTEEFNEHDK